MFCFVVLLQVMIGKIGPSPVVENCSLVGFVVPYAKLAAIGHFIARCFISRNGTVQIGCVGCAGRARRILTWLGEIVQALRVGDRRCGHTIRT